MEKVMKQEKIKGFEEWELDDALRALTRAEEIKKDTKLMEALKPMIEKKKDALISTAEILYGKKDKVK